jgi:hypothetical protein
MTATVKWVSMSALQLLAVKLLPDGRFAKRPPSTSFGGRCEATNRVTLLTT